MTMALDTTAIDQDPRRPGLQLLVDLWQVHTSDGSMLIAAPTAHLAERWTVHTLVSAGNPAPRIRSVALADEATARGFVDDIATVLGIQPGPIPPDELEDAERRLGPLRLATYRLLTERDPSEASPPVTTPAPAVLAFPDHMRLDWARAGYTLGNLAWMIGWLIVAFLPAVVIVGYYAGHLAEWWTIVGVDRALSWWDNRGAFVRLLMWPGSGVTFVWFLLVWVVTHDQVFARFNLYPDRGPVHGRHVGIR